MSSDDKILKLEYFNIAGVAEKIRLALVVSEIAFEDVRLNFVDWPKRKETAKYGQLPIMTLPSGEEVYQSDAMLRYVGSLGDGSLYPSDIMKRLQVDVALGMIGDLTRAWNPSMYIGMRPAFLGHDANMPVEEKDKLVKSMREKFLKEELPKYMGYFTELIEKSDNKYLCGEDLTIADLSALHTILYFKKGIADHVPKESLDSYPIVIAWADRVLAHPKIAEYYENKS
jgi:glutathione S-transferase